MEAVEKCLDVRRTLSPTPACRQSWGCNIQPRSGWLVFPEGGKQEARKCHCFNQQEKVSFLLIIWRTLCSTLAWPSAARQWRRMSATQQMDVWVVKRDRKEYQQPP